MRGQCSVSGDKEGDSVAVSIVGMPATPAAVLPSSTSPASQPRQIEALFPHQGKQQLRFGDN